jgi:hypothetical protein
MARTLDEIYGSYELKRLERETRDLKRRLETLVEEINTLRVELTEMGDALGIDLEPVLISEEGGIDFRALNAALAGIELPELFTNVKEQLQHVCLDDTRKLETEAYLLKEQGEDLMLVGDDNRLRAIWEEFNLDAARSLFEQFHVDAQQRDESGSVD